MDSQVFLIFFLSLFLDFTQSVAPMPRKESIYELVKGAPHSSIDPTEVTQISWHPRAFIYKGFLTDEECDHLIRLAVTSFAHKMIRNGCKLWDGDKLEKAKVADKDGKEIMSEVRTSYGQFLDPAQDKTVADIEARIAAWTFLPEENGEPIQILRYQHGQKYEPHYDYFLDKLNTEFGGQRVATVLMYLSNIEKGGETVFPNSEDTQPKDDSWSDCAQKGYAVKPNKGDALLFFNIHPNTALDYSSLHRACPVIEGEKWSATKWIHVRPYIQYEDPEKSDCTDEDDNCAFWASTGECEKNRMFMMGNEHSSGHCRKSCKVC